MKSNESVSSLHSSRKRPIQGALYIQNKNPIQKKKNLDEKGAAIDPVARTN